LVDTLSGVTGAEEGWRTAPGDTLQWVTPDLKFISLWLNLERTLEKPGWEDGSGEETTAKKRSSFSEAMTKIGRQIFFKKKIG